jgi:hypothetical protein
MPLVGARVVARSGESGKSVYGTTDSEGRFTLRSDGADDGIPPGSYDISVLEDRGDPDSRSRPTIAAKYRDPTTSGLKVEVGVGESKEAIFTLDAK